MKYLKSYKLFESFEVELKDIFSSIMRNLEIITIPYKKFREFNIYVLYGDRMESDEHKLLKELYDNRDIIKEIFNKDYFSIVLNRDKVVIVIKDYRSDQGGNQEYYLTGIDRQLLGVKLPNQIFDMIRPKLSSANELRKGIFTDEYSSNLSLFDWKYCGKSNESITYIGKILDHDENVEALKDLLNDVSDYTGRKVLIQRVKTGDPELEKYDYIYEVGIFYDPWGDVPKTLKDIANLVNVNRLKEYGFKIVKDKKDSMNVFTLFITDSE